MRAAADVVGVVNERVDAGDLSYEVEKGAVLHQRIELPVGWAESGDVRNSGFASDFAVFVESVPGVEGREFSDEIPTEIGGEEIVDHDVAEGSGGGELAGEVSDAAVEGGLRQVRQTDRISCGRAGAERHRGFSDFGFTLFGNFLFGNSWLLREGPGERSPSDEVERACRWADVHDYPFGIIVHPRRSHHRCETCVSHWFQLPGTENYLPTDVTEPRVAPKQSPAKRSLHRGFYAAVV